MNPVAENLSGYQILDVKGKSLETIFQINKPEPFIGFENFAGLVFREGRLIWSAGDINLITRYNTVLPVAGNVSPLKLLKSGAKGLVFAFNDMTEQIHVEEKLRASEERFRTLFVTMVQGVVYQDESGRIIDANPAAERILGLSLEQMQGLTSADPRWHAIHEDGSDYPGEAHPAMIALKTGKTINDVVMAVFHPKDEKYTWISISAVPLFKPGESKPYQVYTTFDDITERKLAEEKIISTERKYRALIEYAPDGVVLIDSDARFKYASPSVERIFGYTQDDMPHCNADELTHPEDLPMVLAELMHLIQDHSYNTTIQYRFRHKNGEWRWIESTFSNLLEVPNVQGIIINFRDIHERMLADAELKKSRELLNEAQRVGHIGHFEWKGTDQPLICSDELYRILELEPQSRPILQHTIAEFMPHEERQRLIAMDMQAFSNRSDIDYEFRINLPSGNHRWLHIHGNVTYSDDGTPVHMVSSVQDITERKLVLEALKRSEEKYRLLFERVKNGYSLNEIIIDNKGNPVEYRILEVNIAFEHIFGKSRKDLINSKGSDLIASSRKDWKEQLRLCGEAALSGNEGDFEIYRNSTGRYYNVHVYSPSEYLFAAIFEDITERKNVEGALKEVEGKYFALFNSKTDITFLTEMSDMGVPGRIIEANDEAVKVTGYSREELLNLLPYDLSKYPSSRSEDVVRQLLVGNTARFEQVVQCKNGSEFPVEVMLYKIQSGEKTFGIISAHDITDKKKAEKTAEDSKRLMDALINNVPIGITIVDSDMNIIWCSQAGEDLPGFEILSNIKKSVQINPMYHSNTKEPVPYDDLPMVKAVNNDVSVENMEVTLSNNKGNPVELSCNAVPVKNSSGEIIGGIMTFQDITSIKKREEENKNLNRLLVRRTEELERSNMELEAFSYSVSHDLRAPLRHISGYSTLLSDKFTEKLDITGAKYIREIEDSANLMGLLIDDILKLSRVTRAELNIQTTNLADIFDSITEEKRKAFPDRKIVIYSGNDLVADCDVSLMKICLNNLFENAWKFTSKNENPVIEFGKEVNNGKVIFFIRDNGVGFDMKYADKLFGAFQRLHNPADFEGTGIGLAIVQRVINKHGGRIWAESEIDVGTTFFFILK
jgi:PAS domain S-box-containing protein